MPFTWKAIAAALELSSYKTHHTLGGLVNYSLLERPQKNDQFSHHFIYSYARERLQVPDRFFFSSRRRHTRSVSAFLLNRSSDLFANKTQDVLLVAQYQFDTFYV